MILRTLCVTLAVAFSGWCTSWSQAAFILATQSDGNSPAIIANPGDIITFNLYLVETGTTSMLDQGLLSFGLRGSFSSTVLEGVSVAIQPQFPFTGGGANPDFSVAGQVDFFGGAIVPPKALTVQLATLQFRAIGPGSASLRFGDLDNGFDDFSLGDLTSLDSTLFGPAFDQSIGINIQVSAVPEPATTALLALGAVAGLGGGPLIRRRLGHRLLLS